MRRWMIAAPCALLTMTAVLAVSGCGNGVLNNGGSTVNPASAKTMTQTLITDAPADAVLSLSLVVDTITLQDSAGNATTVLSTPVPIEASHLDAVQEPLLPPLNIPQDTYVSATITVGAPVVVYLDPTTGKPVKVNATLTSASTTVTFNSPITVSAMSAPICFDLLVGPSVSISGSTVTVTPTFNVTQIPLSKQPTNGGNGKVTGVAGQVVSVSGTNLVIALPNGQQLTIATDNNTVVQGIASIAALTAGEVVNVDYLQQQNGTLLAVRITLLPAAKDVLTGPVTATTGKPVTSFTELVRQPLGPNAPPSATGTSYTVTVNGTTTFGLAPQGGALPTLPFTPLFSANNMFAGQNVAVVASSISGTTAVAGSVALVPQTVGGTVSAMSVTGGYTVYTVTLPAQSALGTLTGATSVVVYAGNGTQQMNANAVSVGSTVRFNGLLFNDGGTLRLVALASCDGPPQPPAQHH